MTATVMIAATMTAGEKIRPLRGALIGRGTTMTGAVSLTSPRSRRH